MRTALRVTLRAMFDELMWHRLDVQLAPAPEPRHVCHFVRVVCDRNPEWYRHFCALHPSTLRGRQRTAIKRRETLSALESMQAGKWPPVYGRRLLAAAVRYYRRNRHDMELAVWHETHKTAA